VFAECIFKFQVGNLVPACIIVEYAVEAYSFFGDDGGADNQFWL
jgi:hypothetical protein